MNEAERQEYHNYELALEELLGDALPILDEISVHTRYARRAMGGRFKNSEGEIEDTDVDTYTLSNEQVELAILIQRLSERISEMGYIARAVKEFYERIREGHKVRLTQIGEEREFVKDLKDGSQVVEKKFVPIAAGVADSMKIQLAHEVFDLHNQSEKFLNKLVLARSATDKTVDTIRSKLSYEKANEKNA